MLLLATLLAGLALGAHAPRLQASEQVPTASAKLVAEGDAWEKKNDLRHALDAYKKADKLAHHQCVSCLLRVATAERGLGHLKKAAKAAQEAALAAQAEPALLAIAESNAGDMLAAEAGIQHPKSKPLKEAEAAYRAGLAVAGSDADRDSFRFKLAVVLMREKRTAEGLAALQALAAAPGAGAELAKEAREIAANPTLAFESLAPDFSFTANNGRIYTKDALHGKVALIDFWGSWCPPCRESVPMLVALRRRFAKSPDFVMLSVGNDSSAQVEEAYATAHHMVWPEYYDGDNRIGETFNVDSLPTFIVLNRDGSIAFRFSGLEESAPGDPSLTRDDIQRAIQQALKK
ncbi:MAG: TlpA family protein disulfide reductase [Terriglobales bacterium]